MPTATEENEVWTPDSAIPPPPDYQPQPESWSRKSGIPPPPDSWAADIPAPVLEATKTLSRLRDMPEPQVKGNDEALNAGIKAGKIVHDYANSIPFKAVTNVYSPEADVQESRSRLGTLGDWGTALSNVTPEEKQKHKTMLLEGRMRTAATQRRYQGGMDPTESNLPNATPEEQKSYTDWSQAYDYAHQFLQTFGGQEKSPTLPRSVAKNVPAELRDKVTAAIGEIAEKNRRDPSYAGRLKTGYATGAADFMGDVQDIAGQGLDNEQGKFLKQMHSAQEQVDPNNPYAWYDPRGWPVGAAESAFPMQVAFVGGGAGAIPSTAAAFGPGMYQGARHEGYSPGVAATSAIGQTLAYSIGLKGILPKVGGAAAVEEKLQQTFAKNLADAGKGYAAHSGQAWAGMTGAEAYNQAVQAMADEYNGKELSPDEASHLQKTLEAAKHSIGPSLLLTVPGFAKEVLSRGKNGMVSKEDLPDSNRAERKDAFKQIQDALNKSQSAAPAAQPPVVPAQPPTPKPGEAQPVGEPKDEEENAQGDEGQQAVNAPQAKQAQGDEKGQGVLAPTQTEPNPALTAQGQTPAVQSIRDFSDEQWDKQIEDIRSSADTFSGGARTTGRPDYKLQDAIDSFSDFARKNKDQSVWDAYKQFRDENTEHSEKHVKQLGKLLSEAGFKTKLPSKKDVQNAKQDKEAGQDDGSRGAQPEVRKEDGDTAKGGQGVSESGQPEGQAEEVAPAVPPGETQPPGGTPPSGPEAIGIKNAYSEQRREEEGFAPSDPVERRAWETTRQEVQKLSDDDVTSRVDDLRSRDLSKEPPNEFDGWVLGRRTTEIENRLMQARQAGDGNASRAAQLELADILSINEKAGTEPARTLAMRRAMWDKDFSLTGIARKWIKSKRGPLSEAEWKRAQDLAADLISAQGGSKESAESVAKAIDEIEKGIAEEKPKTALKRRETIEQRAIRVVDQARQIGVDPSDLREQAKRRAEAENDTNRSYNQQLNGLKKSMGVTADKLEKARNAGRDPVSLVNDKLAATMPGEYPGLGWHGEDYVQQIIAMIDEGSRKIVDWTDKINEVATEMAREKGKTFNPDADDETGGFQDDFSDMPWNAEQEKAIAPEVKSMLGRLSDWLKPKADDALARIKSRHQSTAMDVTGIPALAAADLADLSIVGSYHIANGLLEFGKWSSAMLEAVGDWVKPHLNDVWKESLESIGRPDKPDDLKIDPAKVKKAIGTKKTPIRSGEATSPDEVSKKIADRHAKDGKITSNAVRELAKAIIKSGVHGVEPVSKAVHDTLLKIDPDITRDESNDLLSGRGQVRSPSNDAIDRELTDIKRQRALIDNISGLKKEPSEPPLGTGFKRQDPSDAERRLRQQFNEEKKKHPELRATTEDQLKSATQARETALKNWIKDREEELRTGEKIVRERKPLDMDRLQPLLDEQKRVKALHDEMFPKAPLTVEQKQAAMLRGLKTAGDMIEADLKAGRLSGKEKGEPTPSTEAIDAARKRLEHFKDLREEARLNDPKYQADQDAKQLATYKRMLSSREADLLNQKADMEKTGKAPDKTKRAMKTKLDTPARAQKRRIEKLKAEVTDRANALRENTVEKIGGFLKSMIRGNVLSSLTVIPKIAGAVGWKLPGILKDEVARMALSKIPGFRELAGPLEGQSDIRAYIRGVLDIKQIARNSMDQVLHHGTLSHAEYGEHRGRPGWAIPSPEAGAKTKLALKTAEVYTETPAKLHAAMKEVVRTPAETLAISKLEADAKSHGENIDDPDVKQRIGQAAYEWANRQILMQKSEGASALRSATTARIDPNTGHKTFPGIVKEVIGSGVLPVVRVGMNWAAELVERATGPLDAATRLAWHKMIVRDLDKLPQAAKEAIARKMVYGVSSLPVMALIGWYGYKHFGGFYAGHAKRKDDDLKPGEMQFGDLTVSHQALHSPELGVGQSFSMLRRLSEETDKHGQLKQGYLESLIKTGAAILDTTPLASSSRTFANLSSPDTAPGAVDRLLQTMIVPAWMKFIVDDDVKKKAKR
jgi:hypothetical protein